ncbi:MAG: ABC transporter ATP-binding protein [Sphaerobacter sp.]|nr:ABC transporter ATP-binding protein [Sphaerobacter sp.]
MTQPDTPIVVSRGLLKAYGSVVALDRLDLEVPPGAIGLLGPNGAGKSTLIKLLLGLIKPTEGVASVLGLDIASEGVQIRQRTGYMPESDCLPGDVTAADFVGHMAQMSGLPARAARLRAAEVLYHCGVDEERYRLIKEFSTGMKQRVKLAQAIVHDPALVFLDEPTNGMDPAGREEMLELINRIHREVGITVLLSSHILEDVERVCDYVLLLDQGRLVQHGTVSSLLAGGGDILVEIDGDRAAFAEALAARGAVVTTQDGVLAVRHTEDQVFDLVRDTAADLDVALRGLRVRSQSLEDVYVQQVAAASGGNDGVERAG